MSEVSELQLFDYNVRLTPCHAEVEITLECNSVLAKFSILLHPGPGIGDIHFVPPNWGYLIRIPRE